MRERCSLPHKEFDRPFTDVQCALCCLYICQSHCSIFGDTVVCSQCVFDITEGKAGVFEEMVSIVRVAEEQKKRVWALFRQKLEERVPKKGT